MLPQNTPLQTGPSDQTQDDEIDIGALISTLWAGKWVIAACIAIALLVGGYYAYFVATPIYRATSVVILETDQGQVVDLQSVVSGMSGDTTEVNSELQVLQARGLLGKVVDELNLVNDPEFNSSLRPPSGMSKLIGGVTSLLRGQAEPKMEMNINQKRDRAVSALLTKLTISNVRQSLVFNITVSSEDPAKAALIADTIAASYIQDQIDVKSSTTEDATVWLRARVSELAVTLEDVETRVTEFRATTDLVSPEALLALERQTKELRDRFDDLVEEREVLTGRLEAVTAAQTRIDIARALEDSDLIASAEQAGENTGAAAAFDRSVQTRIRQIDTNLRRAEQQIATLSPSIADFEGRLNRQSADLRMLQQLTREANATSELYEYFLARLMETSVQQGLQQADSRKLSNAVIPTMPTEPRKSLILALSIILGAMIGCGFVLFQELRKTGFRTARDLEQATGYSVLGQIPLMPIKARDKLLQYLTDKPTSAAVEAVRNLRTSLMLSNPDNPPQIIVSTSSFPSEGKTTGAIALAHNLTGLGKSVLLIEGDLRRRTLNEYFPEMPKEGLVSILSGEKLIEDVVFRPTNFGADVLGGEISSINAADLFASKAFGQFIGELRKRYDTVIIDTPPILVVPDARIMAESADAVLFTVHWDHTTQDQVAEAMRVFHSSGQRISGLILSKIDPKKMKRYGSYGRYGAYGGYDNAYYDS